MKVKARQREEGQDLEPRPCVREAEVRVTVTVGSLVLAHYDLCNTCGQRKVDVYGDCALGKVSVRPL